MSSNHIKLLNIKAWLKAGFQVYKTILFTVSNISLQHKKVISIAETNYLALLEQKLN